MWWAAVAQFAASFIGGMGERKKIEAQNRIKEANRDATNITRRGNAELASAVGNLKRWKQSVGNQRVLKQSAMEQGAVKTNLLRMRKDAKQADLATRLDAASQAGAAAAAFSSAGVGGGTRDMINSSLQISEARKLQQIQDQKDTYTYDALQKLTSMQEDTAYRLDDSMIVDQIDHRTAYAAKKKVPNYFETAINAAGSTASSGAGQSAIANSGGSSGSSSDSSWFSQGYSKGDKSFGI